MSFEVVDGKVKKKVNKVEGDLKDVIAKLDEKRPKIEEIDYSVMDTVLTHCDFTKTKNAFESLKVFYEQLWTHVVFNLQDDLHSYQRENGRLIVDWDTERRKAEKLETENETLRKRLQEAGLEEA